MNNQKNYHTKQKNYIQDLFIHHPDLHFTAEQILKTLEESQTPVSKATLYRTLDQMVDAKKNSQIQFRWSLRLLSVLDLLKRRYSSHSF